MQHINKPFSMSMLGTPVNCCGHESVKIRLLFYLISKRFEPAVPCSFSSKKTRFLPFSAARRKLNVCFVALIVSILSKTTSQNTFFLMLGKKMLFWKKLYSAVLQKIHKSLVQPFFSLHIWFDETKLCVCAIIIKYMHLDCFWWS